MVPGTVYLLAFFALFAVIYGSTENQTVVIITVVRMDSFYRPTRVSLSCSASAGVDVENATYWRRMDGKEQRLEFTNGRKVTFEVTPALEGIYFCKVHEVYSANEIEVVGECMFVMHGGNLNCCLILSLVSVCILTL